MQSIPNRFTAALGTQLPIIMAPMFLVSNLEMMTEGMRSGVAATFPTLNFREEGELEKVLDACNAFKAGKENQGTYGVNLIVQKTNPYFLKHLKACTDRKVPFYITSLGSPEDVIKAAHEYGGIVFCDVTNLKHAEKAVSLGCDGLIAVGQGAGGHAGPLSLQVLIPALRREFPGVLVAAAGGVATGAGLLSTLALGADAASIGTLFIASEEATVSPEYKKAILDYGMEDIVMTDKISGTPCNVINTPYVQQVGVKQNWFERFLNRNRRTKKWFKMLVQVRGMKSLEKAAFSATYKTMWCAGQTVELIHEIKPVEAIVRKMVEEYTEAQQSLPQPVQEPIPNTL